MVTDSARSVDGGGDGERELVSWISRIEFVFINCLVGKESDSCGVGGGGGWRWDGCCFWWCSFGVERWAVSACFYRGLLEKNPKYC